MLRWAPSFISIQLFIRFVSFLLNVGRLSLFLHLSFSLLALCVLCYILCALLLFFLFMKTTTEQRLCFMCGAIGCCECQCLPILWKICNIFSWLDTDRTAMLKRKYTHTHTATGDRESESRKGKKTCKNLINLIRRQW